MFALRVLPVSAESTIAPKNYRIVAPASAPEFCILVGWNTITEMSRMSSIIEHVNAQNMTVTTVSGRVYHLDGTPGDERYGAELWDMFYPQYSCVDRTTEFLPPGMQ